MTPALVVRVRNIKSVTGRSLDLQRFFCYSILGTVHKEVLMFVPPESRTGYGLEKFVGKHSADEMGPRFPRKGGWQNKNLFAVLAWVKDMQPLYDLWDPYVPTTEIGYQLHSIVGECLVRAGYSNDGLCLCMAVGSPADWRGVDCFFFWQGIYVTVDISGRNKTHLKADVLLSVRHLQEDLYRSVAEQSAERLIRKLLKRQEKRKQKEKEKRRKRRPQERRR